MGNQAPSSSPPTTSSTKRKKVTFAPTPLDDDERVVVHSDNNDDNNDDSIPSHVIERLEHENQILRDRCDRLEAQAILVSVQQLDYLTQCIAWCLYLLTIWFWSKLVKSLILPALERHFLTYTYRQLCWKLTCELTCNIRFDCHTHEKLVLLVSHWLWAIGKYVLGFGLVYFYHRRTKGLDLRRCQVFAVALVMLARIKLCRERERMFMTRKTADGVGESGLSSSSSSSISGFGDEMSEEAIWDANYEVSARFLYISFLRLRGLWTKTAQYLSSRADFVPTSYVRELSKLQDQAPATPWNEIIRERILPSSLLRMVDVDPVPIASASIGQVHVAHFKKSGEKVVLKIQHPFAKTLLLDDFRSLAMICRIWSFLEPEYKFFEILMNEWANEARKELDFLQEAQNLCEAQSTLEQMKQNEPQAYFITSSNSIPYDVEIPQPMLSLCTRKVLVMSFCEGVRIDKSLDLECSWLPKEDVMESVAQTFAHFMYNGTIFNGDPHPGNLFLRPGIKERDSREGGHNQKGFTLILLDWGLAKRLPPTKRIAFAQMAYAAATVDFGLLLDSFDLLGLKMKREDVHQDMDAIRFLLRELAPRIIARRRIKAKLRHNQANLQSKTRGERVPVESKAYPGEFFFFVRVNELLHGLGSRLQVQLNYLDIIKPFAECALLQYNLINSTTESIPIEPLPIVDSELNYKVSSVLKQLEATNRIAGAQVCVLDANGNALVDLAAGHMGGFLRQHPMRRDTLILGFSCTKAVTATLAHIMVAEGYLTPDEPVCDRVWPSFCPYENPPPALFAAMHDTLSKDEVLKRWAWKRNITLRHILTHSAGLWSTLPPRLTIQRLSSCESCVAAFEYDALNPADTILPSRAPGEKGEYHFLSFGWLVAGVLCGAYRERHMKECTFDDVYQAVLLPKLSAATQNSGFRPNGCDSSDPLALVEIDAAKTRFILQVEREAESMGEDTSVTLSSEERIKRFEPLLPSLKGREFLIDPRIWNCKTGRTAVCPAAGGRFSARGLAHFYRDLGQKGILLSKERVEWASSSHVVLENVMQGQTTMVNNSTRQERTVFGLGYQIVSLNEDEEVTPTAFGHAGVGGSIGFYHKPSGVSVAVMLNKADVDTETAKKIVTVIAEHLGW